MKCRFCGAELNVKFCDLGATPISTAYVSKDNKNGEKVFPLCAYVCEHCKLVQLDVYETPENIFKEYSYFSSVSSDWLEHCKQYSEMMIKEYNISTDNFIVEIASNDGYLLKYFVDKNITVLGIDPAENVAEVARKKGVETICDFFGVNLAKNVVKDYRKADLIAGNNVFAHVPDINDFVEGMKILLNDDGVITLEFPHILNLIKSKQFDTIYHEHFSYLSILTTKQIFNKHGLDVFKVEKLDTHGGSVRVYGKHKECNKHIIDKSVETIIKEEIDFGLDNVDTYRLFNEQVKKIKRDTLKYLIKMKDEGKKIAAFGAPAKGNTFVNYCGIRCDLIDYTVDETPYKQGLLLPGVLIPIYPLEKLIEDKPDVLVVLPWNWIDEILNKVKFIKEYGGEIVTFIPEIRKY